MDGAAGAFGSDGHSNLAEPAIDVMTLHAKIGERKAGERIFARGARRRDCRGAQNDDRPFACVAGHTASAGIRDPRLRLLSAQADPAANFAIMGRNDPLHTNFPFAGRQMLRDVLAAEGIKAGRLRVLTLMEKVAIKAVRWAIAEHKIYYAPASEPPTLPR